MWHSTKGKRGLKSVRHSLSPVSNKIIRLASKHLTTPPCPLAATDVASSAQPLFFLLVRALASQSGQTTRYVLSACILLYTYHLCTTRSRRVTLARDEGQALPRSLFRLNPACAPPASCASCSNFSCNLRLQENYTISVFLVISLLSRRYINYRILYDTYKIREITTFVLLYGLTVVLTFGHEPKDVKLLNRAIFCIFQYFNTLLSA